VHALGCGYAAVVGGIIIVAVRTSDRGGSAVITGRVITTCGSGTDRSGTDRSSANAYRHSRTYTTVNATAIDAATIDAAPIHASAICEGVS
jgi:hypothetical protein